MASGIRGIEEALVESRTESHAVSAISGCDGSVGVDREVGSKVGHSRSDPATESRKGLSLASIKLRLFREGLGA